jgi:hypothetical protein
MTRASELPLLRRVEWYGWGITGLSTLLALVAGYPLVASGCAIGGVMSVLHFKWLALFFTAMVDPQRRQRYNRAQKIVLGAYIAKYLIIIAVVYVLFRYRIVDPLGFLGGLSAVFIAICAAGITRAKPWMEQQD